MQHEQFMARALQLARRGIGLTSPNPCVGAVLVDDAGRIVGEGTHTYDGRKHAEVLALEQAGEGARGATLYLNLEPCCHQGRTGPCVDAVIAAGVKRVVASMVDPNPEVSGQGFARLSAAGIDVMVGLGEHEARRLNEGFSCWIRTGRPLVVLKTAMTLDGKIAPPPESPARGEERGYITSKASRQHVQELRHASDAILVGVGTVFADDPVLTDRSGLPRRRPLLRCVLDTRLRIPLDSKLVRSAHDDLVVFCAFADADRQKRLEDLGVRVEQVGHTGMASRPNLLEVVALLGREHVTSLLIEGGSLVNWATLAAGVADKVFLYYAPKILGGSAVPFSTGMGFNRMADAAQIHDLTLHRFGEDFAVEGYLRDPYS